MAIENRTNRPPAPRVGCRRRNTDHDARRAFKLRAAGLTYSAIARELGVSEGWAWKLTHRVIPQAPPTAVKAALAQCEAMVRELPGADLGALLGLQARLRALVVRRGRVESVS
jgi:hypothetical protein